MTKLLAFLMMGPLILLAGLIFKFFPPKKINVLYGYRTKRSMLNDDTWQFANVFSSNLMIAAGLFTTLIQIIFWNYSMEDFILASLAALLISLCLSIILTEIKLKKTFDKDGNRLNP